MYIILYNIKKIITKCKKIKFNYKSNNNNLFLVINSNKNN